MQRLEVSGTVQPLYGSLGVKGLKASAGPEDPSKFRLPNFKTTATGRWQGCQPYAPAAFTPPPGNIPGTFFC